MKTTAIVFLLLMASGMMTTGAVLSDEEEKIDFPASLAQYVSGVVLEQEDNIEGGKKVISSVVWIPTYYGYHTFMGVLDSYIQNQTTISRLRTRRVAADRNHYIIMLSDKDVSVTIIYDTVNSLLIMSAPPGY